MELAFGIPERDSENVPQFVKDSFKWASTSALLQEMYLQLCMRKFNHYGRPTEADFINWGRYDIVLAVLRYHKKFDSLMDILPESPKPRDWWENKENIARRLR
eukprot:UN28797